MPPPPWELFMTDRPSIRDGLHWKLLGNGLRLFPVPAPLPQSCGLLSRSVVPAGKPLGSAPSVHGLAPLGTRTPFDNTVIPAPSYAPRSDVSCNCSAMLPFRVASQPTVASSGNRSTCGFEVLGVK